MPEVVVIQQGSPEIIEGVSMKSGAPKAYRIVKQAALLVREDGVTQSFSYQPGKDEPVLAPGKYALGHRPYVQEGALRLAPVLLPTSPGVTGGAK